MEARDVDLSLYGLVLLFTRKQLVYVPAWEIGKLFPLLPGRLGLVSWAAGRGLNVVCAEGVFVTIVVVVVIVLVAVAVGNEHGLVREVAGDQRFVVVVVVAVAGRIDHVRLGTDMAILDDVEVEKLMASPRQETDEHVAVRPDVKEGGFQGGQIENAMRNRLLTV